MSHEEALAVAGVMGGYPFEHMGAHVVRIDREDGSIILLGKDSITKFLSADDFRDDDPSDWMAIR